jgi:hypothetical protein
MCRAPKAPEVKPPAPSAPPPAPSAAVAQSDPTNDSLNEDSMEKTKRRGRSSLRIPLIGGGGGGTGLNIPNG